MSRMLRSDFATASVGLVGNAHRNNLVRLHDWLIDEVGLLPHETVLGVANYQQGSFGRLPNHMLLVTDECIAYPRRWAPVDPTHERRHQSGRPQGRPDQR